MMKKAYIFALSFFCVSALSGCAGMGKFFGYRTFPPEVVKNDVVDKEYLKSLISPDTDLRTALNKIYGMELRGESPYKIGDVFEARRFRGGYHVDIDVYQTYCSAKSGEVYRWNYSSVVFYTCEINGSIDSALELAPKLNDANTRSLYYNSKEGFNNYLQRKVSFDGPFTHFVSDNKIFDFGRKYKDKYTVTVIYQNKEKNPLTVNFLNSYLIIDGAKYAIDFGEKTKSFTDFHGKTVDYSKKTINPDEEFKAYFEVTISGLANKKDFSDMAIDVDGKIKGDNFKKVNEYDLKKSKLNEAGK